MKTLNDVLEGFYKTVQADLNVNWFNGVGGKKSLYDQLKQLRNYWFHMYDPYVKSYIEYAGEICNNIPVGSGFSFTVGVKTRYIIYKKYNNELHYLIYKRSNSKSPEKLLQDYVDHDGRSCRQIIISAFCENRNPDIKQSLESLCPTAEKDIVNFE